MFQNAITLYEKRNKQRYTSTCAHTGISPHFEAWMIMKEGECEVWHCLYTGCDLMISLGSCCDRWDTVIKSVPCKWQSHKSFSSCHNELIDQVIIQAFLKNKSIVLKSSQNTVTHKNTHTIWDFLGLTYIGVLKSKDKGRKALKAQQWTTTIETKFHTL